MSYKIRRWLYRFFILLFIILTTYTSLYATGYQINLSGPWRLKRLLVKTGTLALDSQPTGANIFINEKPQATFSLPRFRTDNVTTPAKIKNLAPGDYEVRLEKNGYWPWEKKLTINAEQTTYAEDINLFKKDSILNILSCSCQEIDLSPSRRWVLLKQGHKIIDLKNGREMNLDILENIDNPEWLESRDQILINQQIFDLSNGQNTDYRALIGNDIKNLYYEERDKRLYYQDLSTISYFDLNKKTSTALLSAGPYLTYSVQGDYIFYLKARAKATILGSYRLSDQNRKEIELPMTGDYRFWDESGATLNLWDRKNSRLFLFDLASLRLTRDEIRNFRGGLWLQPGQLLYYTDFEIYLYDVKQNNNTLLNRIGTPLTGLAWQAKNNYLIYSTKASINSLDLATDNITELLGASDISSIFLDSKNSTLYFTAEIKDQPGLYKMIVQ